MDDDVRTSIGCVAVASVSLVLAAFACVVGGALGWPYGLGAWLGLHGLLGLLVAAAAREG